MALQEERNLLGMLFMLHRTCNIICKKTTDAIARGEEPSYGGLYAPPAEPCVDNPPTKKGTRKDKPSSSHRKND
jgi:hypothetical protein